MTDKTESVYKIICIQIKVMAGAPLQWELWNFSQQIHKMTYQLLSLSPLSFLAYRF